MAANGVRTPLETTALWFKLLALLDQHKLFFSLTTLLMKHVI
jgi:hypothetical protein